MIELKTVQRVGGVLAIVLSLAVLALGQAVEVQGRPVSAVKVEGIKETDPQLVYNQINLKAGDPYDADTVAKDIQNTRLGRFGSVRVNIQPNPDGTVTVTYVVDEQKIISDVQVVGNKKKSDQELLEATMLKAGDPLDPFLIDRAKQVIKDKYGDSGYFLADVSVDEQTLKETGILILRVREGPRVKVRGVEFDGNTAFQDELLQSKVKTNTYFIIFRKGQLSKEQLDQDVATLREYHQQRGYLDVRVGRQVALSDDQKDAVVKFVIDEGRQYTVNSLKVQGNQIYSEEQILLAMPLKVGDVYSQDRQKGSVEAVSDLYGKLGRIESKVRIERVFDPTAPTVDLTVNIEESKPYTVGAVIIRGNSLTQDKVFRRQVRGLEPGHRYDGTGIKKTEQRIRETGLVDSRQPDPVKLTVLGDKEDDVRDALIEVKEANTGSLSFGAAVSSDSGIFGAIDLTQRNFDITDLPESWGEFFTGQAFRGAGQYFAITLQPGNEFQRYQVTFREPYMFDTDYFLDTNLFYYTREREDWDESRIGGTLGVGKRFGDVWQASVRGRGELVEISDLEKDAPIDALAVEGDHFIESLGFFVTRSTVDSRFFPTQGSRWNSGVERVGMLGGDFEFTRLSTEYTVFFTVAEDFFGRKTVLSFGAEAGWIPDAGTEEVTDKADKPKSHTISDTPLFERFYAGGHRSLRGFEFRGAGPRGIELDSGDLGDSPVGGDWMFLFKTEYNFPIYEKFLRGVVFMDTGTVQETLGFDEFRVSVGAGIRLQLPFFGQAPFAFDLAYPLLKEDGDETRFFSFDIALPF